MIKTEKQGFAELIKIALPYFSGTLVYAILVLWIEEYYGDHIFKLSAQIGSVFGLAVAFFLGFRMNSAYDRWWEARKIFGELVNNSRSFSAKIYTYFSTSSNVDNGKNINRLEVAKELIDLNSCFVEQLKNEIHEIPSPIFSKEDDDLFHRYSIDKKNKISNEILLAMSIKIERTFSKDSNIEKSDLMMHINDFYRIQGKAERINNTPFLKIYSAFTRLTVMIYVLIIPFIIGDIDIGGEDSYFEFLAIPLFAIISTLFLTINTLANLYGEPLNENKTSVPIDQICKTIIQDCKEVSNKITLKIE